MKKTKKTKTNAPNCDNLDCIKFFTCNWNPFWYLGRLLQWNYEHIKFLLCWRNASLLGLSSGCDQIFPSGLSSRWAEIMQLRSAAEIHFLQDWELPPLGPLGFTTAIHWYHHRAPVILDERSVKDLVVCDASGGKQDGVGGCSKSVILWWKYWMTTEVV